MKNKKFSYLFCFLALLLVFNVSIVSAAEFRVAGEGGNVVVSSDGSIKNLYTVGNMVSVSGRVQKDLYAAGNVVTIDGSVENNLGVGAGTVVIRSDVGGNVHVGGGSIVIEGNVAGDLFLAGGNIIISKSASIGGDLVIGAGTVDIQGLVMGNVSIGGEKVTINSKINGRVKIEAKKLTIGSSAIITQDLEYSSYEEAEINDDAKILGTVNFDKKTIKHADKTKAARMILSVLSIFFLVKILIVITTGLVLVYFFQKITKNIVKKGLDNFWSSLGLGFATLFLTPILAIILAATVIGLWLAGLLVVAYLLLVVLSCVLASITFGSWLMKVLKKQKDYSIDWSVVILGAIVLKIVCFVPLVGWFVCFVFFLISLGSLCKLTYQAIIKK